MDQHDERRAHIVPSLSCPPARSLASLTRTFGFSFTALIHGRDMQRYRHSSAQTPDRAPSPMPKLQLCKAGMTWTSVPLRNFRIG